MPQFPCIMRRKTVTNMIILGINNKAQTKKLLRPYLNLKNCIDICRTADVFEEREEALLVEKLVTINKTNI